MIDDLRRRDLAHLWHPYTEITSFEASNFPVIERAEGSYLFEVGGRPILDGISSWWCVNLGHGHPKLVSAIREQTALLQHAILGGMSHPKAIALAERLAAIAPGKLSRVFFAGDGSSAVEAALKIALQYWTNIGVKDRARFISLADGYHGDTLGAIGVGYIESFHRPWRPAIVPSRRALSPHCARCPFDRTAATCRLECFDSMADLLRDHGRETAAVIVEPLCQAAAGMRIYPEEYLRRLRRACDESGTLLIADEIAVGFGRTGALFACERAGIAPDLMTIGKGVTGGYLPLSAVMVTEPIFDTFRREGGLSRTLYHGHTFGGNPIAAAAALAALAAYEEENVIERSRARAAELERGMRRIAERLPGSWAGCLGMIAAIEIAEACGGAERARRIGSEALALGLFLRPLGPVVYLWPPLTVTDVELSAMLSILSDSVTKSA